MEPTEEGNAGGGVASPLLANLIGELNRHLKGWMNYFSFGYPSSTYCEIERYVRDRLIQHLQRRSQRPCRRPLRRTMASAFGPTGADPSIGHCACLRRELSGEPDAGAGHQGLNTRPTPARLQLDGEIFPLTFQ